MPKNIVNRTVNDTFTDIAKNSLSKTGNKKPRFGGLREYMVWLLDRRVENIIDKAEKVKQYVSKLPEDSNALADREWLESFTIGNGVDICCGDYLIGDAYGVDVDIRALGVDYFSVGDELAFASPGSLDFIVTNYLDGFSNPLKALHEWYRSLREGGTLALTCRDAEAYNFDTSPSGALENHRRGSVYTQITLIQYLNRAGYTTVEVYKSAGGVLRAVAIK